ELDVTRDGGEQFVAQDGDKIAGPKRDALMGKQDLKPLAGDRGAAARLEKSEQVHAALRPNRRVKKVFFSSEIATGAVVSPPRRRAASRYASRAGPQAALDVKSAPQLVGARLS